MMQGARLRIVVMGYVVRGPLAGMAWSDLQYIDSLKALGHDVVYVEDSDDYPSCYDPVQDETGTDPSYGTAFAAASLARIDAGDAWSFYDAHSGTWLGPLAASGPSVFNDADVVLNLAGVNPLRDWAMSVPVRIYVDQDPAFTQIRDLQDAARAELVGAHNAFFTFAENIGAADCSIPDDGVTWRPTRQPVLADRYEVLPPADAGAPFTTVMQWESYPPLELDGRRYAMKSESFASLMDLPRLTRSRLELAVGAPDPVREALEVAGWATRDPRPVTRDLGSYLSFIGGSQGEIGIAKHGYVSSWSGWFSERSLTYMVCGRPVVLQNTGFSGWLPTGEGVLAFRDALGAAAGIDEVLSDPARHGRAARDLAHEYFDGRTVMSELLASAAQSSMAGRSPE
jgi:hypothetical protein